MSAELNVQLKLLLDQVQGDATKAAEIIKRTIGGAVGSGSPGSPAVPREGAAEKDARRARMIDMRTLKDKEAFYKNMSMLAGPVFSPGGGLSTMFAARQVFSALRTDKGKGIQSALSLGTGIGGSAVATGGLVSVATAIGVALKSFQVALEQSVKAIRFSSSLYSKSMTSGLGIKTEATRTILSSALGVSEKDIFRFGAAISYLAPKIKTATDAISKATIPLATLDINFKVLQTNMMALAATLVEKATPALMTFLNALNTLTEFAIKNSGTIFSLAKAGAKTGLSAVFGNAKVELISALLGKIIDLNSKSEGGKLAPTPASFMKQMPASTWERMGLVIGGGGGTNYAQQTAEATKRSAKFLEVIARGKFNTSNPFEPIPSTP